MAINPALYLLNFSYLPLLPIRNLLLHSRMSVSFFPFSDEGYSIAYRVSCRCNLDLGGYRFDILGGFDHIWLYELGMWNILGISDERATASKASVGSGVRGEWSSRKCYGPPGWERYATAPWGVCGIDDVVTPHQELSPRPRCAQGDWKSLKEIQKEKLTKLGPYTFARRTWQWHWIRHNLLMYSCASMYLYAFIWFGFGFGLGLESKTMSVSFDLYILSPWSFNPRSQIQLVE